MKRVGILVNGIEMGPEKMVGCHKILSEAWKNSIFLVVHTLLFLYFYLPNISIHFVPRTLSLGVPQFMVEGTDTPRM
jgi:hypothetical protein